MLLRYSKLEGRGLVDVPGDIVMDVPANNSNGQLIERTGGSRRSVQYGCMARMGQTANDQC